MNFRTTLLLLCTLIAIGAIALFTRDRGTGTPPAADSRTKLVTLAEGDITRIDLANTAGENAVLERDGADWKLTAPTPARADSAAVQGLLSTLTSFNSQGQVNLAGNAAALGLEPPSAVVKLTQKSGNAVTLHIGNRTGTGGNVYVRVNDSPQVQLVPALLLDDLEKPISDLRDRQLVHTPSTQFQQLTLKPLEGATIELQRHGNDWRLVKPIEAKAETSAVSDMLFALAGLRAEEFVDKPARDAASFEFDQPVLTASYSATPAATQPAATQLAFESVRFGRHDDLLRKSVYATVGEGGAIAKVPATSLASLQKTVLDLRDREVLKLNSADVQRITIAKSSPSASQPAAPVVIERVPPEPTTVPATTQSIEPPSPVKWRLAGSAGGDADGTKVDALLRALAPLRAEKYLDALPAVSVGDVMTIAVETSAATHSIELRPQTGEGASVQGSYNGLNFDTSRALLDAANGSFAARAHLR